MTDITNPALIIIDMQRDFLDVGAPIEVARGRNVIQNLYGLLSAFRSSNLPVIHVVTLHRADGKDWEILEPHRVPSHCIEGTAGAEIVSPLKPIDHEFVVVKKRYSAFFNTDLDMILRRMRVETLVITGVTTECCVRSTAFDGYFRDYKIVIPFDCTDSQTETKKTVSLQDMKDAVGDVLPSVEVVAQLKPRDI
jgi:nicotinamidase-related amidase